jgi:hypothetical protein
VKIRHFGIILVILILAMPVMAEYKTQDTAKTENKTAVAATTATTTAVTTTATTTTTAASVCKSGEVLDKEVIACKDKGWAYETSADKDGCKVVNCYRKEVVCASEAELKKQMDSCSENWDYEKYKGPDGCTYVKCKTDCPDEQKAMITCKELGMDYEMDKDEKGCTKITCKKTKKVESVEIPDKPKAAACKKYEEDGCLHIKCNDGYYLNTCTFCTEGAVQIDKTTGLEKALEKSGNATEAGEPVSKGKKRGIWGWFKGIFS